MTDKALILAYQSGDDSALGKLYIRYKEKLFWFIYRYVNDEKKANDLVQDTFLGIMERSAKYRPIATVSTWLHIQAKGHIYHSYRKENAQKRSGIEISKDMEESPVRLVDKNIAPDDALDLKMKYNKVRDKANQINQDYAQAVLLHDYQGYKYHEIADMMDVEMGTVKSRIYRGRKLLQ